MANNKVVLSTGNPNLPQLNHGRTKHNLNHTNHLDINAGLLYPIDSPIEVIPGDTFKMSQRTICRMSNPPQVPVMDSLQMDVFYFYVPYRILWKEWDKFIVNDTGTSWTVDASYRVPTFSINVGQDNVAVGGLLDFLGVPSGSTIIAGGISCLPSLAYYNIWNNYFRFEPLQTSVSVDTISGTSPTLLWNDYSAIDSSSSLTGGLSYAYHIANYVYGPIRDALCPVNRLGDYFSRCLPAPSKGEDVLLNLSVPESYSLSNLDGVNALFGSALTADGDIFVSQSSGTSLGSYSDGYGYVLKNSDTNYVLKGFANLYGGSVSDLINAFAVYRVQTIDARYGSRITEFTKAHYNVNVPDYRVDLPELIAHHKFDINVNQVTQTSQTASTEYLGTPGATSLTNDYSFMCTKSFVEFGMILPLACIRVKHHSYAQGYPFMFRKTSRFDYYFNEFRNIVDQPVYSSVLYYLDDTVDIDNVFGYQEAYAEYKFIPSRVSHHMRPYVTDTLAVWTYTDDYDDVPTLSAEWLYEPQTNIDRTMFLTASATVSQFILDIGFFVDAYREVPLHSNPGMINGIL